MADWIARAIMNKTLQVVERRQHVIETSSSSGSSLRQVCTYLTDRWLTCLFCRYAYHFLPTTLICRLIKKSYCRCTRHFYTIMRRKSRSKDVSILLQYIIHFNYNTTKTQSYYTWPYKSLALTTANTLIEAPFFE